MIFHRGAIVLATLAHGLAWAAFLFLVFWPSLYQGVSVETMMSPDPGASGPRIISPEPGPDGQAREEVRLSKSLIEVNGPWVLVPVAVPLLLTAAGLLAVLSLRGRRTRLALLWLAAALLLGFCVLTGFSIGIFYLLAALMLLASAIILSVTRRRDARATTALHH